MCLEAKDPNPQQDRGRVLNMCVAKDSLTNSLFIAPELAVQLMNDAPARVDLPCHVLFQRSGILRVFGELQKPGDEQRGLNGVSCTMHKLIAISWQRPFGGHGWPAHAFCLTCNEQGYELGSSARNQVITYAIPLYSIDTPSTEMRDLEIAKGVC